MTSPLSRAEQFCERFGLRVPILLAPMAGACPPSLSIAVAKAGGMGSAGALLMPPGAIAAWMQEFRSSSNGAVQLNLWIPDPPPTRDAAHEAKVREFLGRFGPPVAENAGDATPPDFAAQCEALLTAGPAVISSIMGLYPREFVARLKERGITWFATATTVAEALAAEAAGADVIAAQGAEAGGHRGAFDAAAAERRSIATDYALAALSPDAPSPAPYPVQRGLTAAMREAAAKEGDVQRMQAWAGQSAALARAEPAEDVVNRLWEDARKLLA